ncbi:MAG TPA: hypothetical protein VGG27_02570 [Magnetospirillaceae bacterium]|jgi:hypothetical protein
MRISSLLDSGQRATLPAIAHTAELSTAEAFAVVSLRLWAALHRQPNQHHPDWRSGFAAAGVDEAERAFNELFRLVLVSAQRGIDVRCARCAHLGGDEIAVLRMVSQLQRCRWFEAETVLSDWLPAPVVNTALAAAMIFSTALAGAGLVLPLRAWPKPDLDAFTCVSHAAGSAIRLH